MTFDVEAMFRSAGDFIVKADQHPVGALIFVVLFAMAVVALMVIVYTTGHRSATPPSRTAFRRGR